MSTTSFGNTPQATDDYFSLEATLLTEDTENIVYLAVMADDLGGKAKVLYSLDDGSSEGGLRPIDLLQADAVGATNYSELGARIWITRDGKVAYDITSIPAETLEAAKIDGYIEDTFAYAIRLATGTLSWATATVQIQALNDAPVISVQTGDNDAAGLQETDTGRQRGCQQPRMVVQLRQRDIRLPGRRPVAPARLHHRLQRRHGRGHPDRHDRHNANDMTKTIARCKRVYGD